ncbi:hypothetical protein [Mesobacillus boroniphilus]|uniref:hypothetical protein n=1 Tax=Mesobacillus boroniphilus TaxID=308892 RepID=UPI00201B54C2|nr:hypothetical protein [Mesobacillus boroniphilus]
MYRPRFFGELPGDATDKIVVVEAKVVGVKVLSMIQPRASLFVLREAQYETRSWGTKYRGSLAIHTSKKVNKVVCSHVAVKSLLLKHGYKADDLPAGVIIATCYLENCLRVWKTTRHGPCLRMGES